MLSVLLGMGFFSRQVWGWLSDRVGGLLTALLSSLLQCAAMTGFLFTQDDAGLFTVATAFGLGFSALIPAYVLTIRELYPVGEAHWRVPTLLLFSGSGMATGGWLAGYLYDCLRLLPAGLRHRRRLQRRQHRDPVHAAGAPAGHDDGCYCALVDAAALSPPSS